MLSVVLNILSILGILLLCLLALAVLLILLVLFFPICYKLTGKKNMEELSASVRVIWLFGFLRVGFDYPEPGRLFVKVLPFTVFDSGKQIDGKAGKKSGDSREKSKKDSASEEKAVKEDREKEQKQAAIGEDALKVSENSPVKTDDEKQDYMSSESDAADDEVSDSSEPVISKKFKKIKYTICSIYDKIKNIWENISYYMELLQEEETKQLFSHVILRLGKILKSIRPRHIRGQVLYGTGSPDTTGYVYGVYGMLSPFLGSRLLVTPDFTRAVLEGDIYISGHITVFTILWNGLKVLVDKKLRRFIKKIKAGRKK